MTGRKDDGMLLLTASRTSLLRKVGGGAGWEWFCEKALIAISGKNEQMAESVLDYR